MFLKTNCVLTTIFLLSSFSIFSQNLDVRLLNAFNQNKSTFKNSFFKATSQSVIVFNLAAPAGVFTAGLIKHDKKLQMDAAYMVGGFLVSSIVTQGLKRVVKRERPYVTYSDIHKLDVGGGYSFPSGHTSAAFSTATSLSLLYPKWYVIAPVYLYAGLVGYSRVYEGVHYPSDVLAGAIVGAGGAWLSYKAEKWMDRRSNAKKHSTAVIL